MDTRETILDAAARVFSQHGFRGSTTRRIAEAASVNEVTVFRYFGSKAALLQEAVRGINVNASKNSLPHDPVEPARELTCWCATLVEHLSDRRSVIRKCMGELEERPELAARAAEAPKRATSELCAYFRRLKATGHTNDEFDAPAAAAMLIGALFHDSMGREMMPEIYPKPASKAPGRYAELVLRAIGVGTTAKGRTPARDKRKPSTPATVRNSKTVRTIKVVVMATMTAAAIALAVPALGAQVQPQSASVVVPVALSLDDAVRMAEGQSEAVQIARAGVRRADGQKLQAHSQLLPQIYGSAGYTRTLKSEYSSISTPAADTTVPASPAPPCDGYLRGETGSIEERIAGLETASRCANGLNPFAAFSSLPFGQANQYRLGLSVSQNLFAGGRILAQNNAAAAGRRSADIELLAQRAQIILDVTQAYYDAALADRLVSITDASFTQTEGVLRQVQLNKDVGNTSEFELLRAQVTRDNQRPQVIQRRSDREVAYLRLKQLLNIPLEQNVSLTTSIDNVAGLPDEIRLTGLSVTSYEAPDTSASNRSAVRQADEAVRAQQELLTVAKSQRLPSLSLSSQYGAVAYPQSGLPGSSDFRANWTIGVSAQVPIFTGGRIRGDEMVAQANLLESRARLQQVREFASLDARVALNALNQAQATWEASRGTAEQAARAYTIAEVRYREGISTQLELNDSRILMEQATVNRALAARNLQIARIKLALLPNLPLQSSNTAASALQGQQSQQQSTQQSAAQQAQSAQQQGTQQNTLTSQQQTPQGF